MIVPKNIKRFCPTCKKHTEQKVSNAKRKTPFSNHTQSHGSKPRQKGKHRGLNIGMGNRGKFSRGAMTKWKMSGKKQSKKTDLRFTCNVCKKTSVDHSSIRAKKVEFKN